MDRTKSKTHSMETRSLICSGVNLLLVIVGQVRRVGDVTLPGNLLLKCVSAVSDTVAVVMEWRSCSVCLEEMIDSDLLIHPECGGVLCSTCLQSSVQHFAQEDKKMPCPVSREYVQFYKLVVLQQWFCCCSIEILRQLLLIVYLFLIDLHC